MSRLLKIGFGLAYTLYFIWIAVMASVPPVSRDALTHHLALPKLWLQRGEVFTTPEISFSYYPQLIDLLYMLPVSLGVDTAAKYIHWAFGLGTALLLFLFLRRRLGWAWGALGGLMFLTLPLIQRLSISVYVDLGLLFFATASLLAVLMWLEDSRKWQWLLLAGIAAGLALSSKYNALVSFTVLALLLPWFYLRSRADKQGRHWPAIGYAALFALLAALVFSPWLIRNYLATGNPIYPLHQSSFAEKKPQSPSSNPASSNKPLSPILLRKFLYGESLPYTLLIPARIFFEGQDDDPARFDGQLNPLLLLLPLSLLLLYRQLNTRTRMEARLLAAYAGLILLYSFFATDMRVRYVITIIPPLLVLSVYALYALRQRLSGNTATGALALLLALYMAPNLSYSVQLGKTVAPLAYHRGDIGKSAYISHFVPEYPLVQRANQSLPPDGKLLGMYLGFRRYYFDVPVTLQYRQFWTLSAQAQTPRQLADALRQTGLTHILLRYDLFNQTLAQKQPEQQQVILQFFQHYTQTLETHKNFGLHRILVAPISSPK